MRASVIVLSWNGAEFLPDCLNHLFRQDYPDFEVIVVDNGSTDGSPGLVAAQFPAARLIRNERNLGVAAGSNVGLAVATGEALVLLNQDTRVRPDWLAQLVHGVTSDPRVGIGGCKTLYPDGQTIQHAGGIIRLPLALPDHRGYRLPDDGRWDEQKEVDYVTGAALALRRDVLQAIGLLDEGFYPAYYEDADLCARARAAGYGVTYFPRATLIHVESTSLGMDSPAYLRHFHHGRLRYLLKHTDPSAFLGDVVPAELERLRAVEAAEERLALWHAYREAREQLGDLAPEDKFVAASPQEWLAVREHVEAGLAGLREALFRGPRAQPPVPADPALLVEYHTDRLYGVLRQTPPAILATRFIPAESERRAAETPSTQQVLAEAYRQTATDLDQLLPAAYPGETLLAKLAWDQQLARPAEAPSSQIANIGRLGGQLQALERNGQFREHAFSSGVPLVGPLIARLRTLWCNVAARWAVRTLAEQQHSLNCEIRAILNTVERSAIENDRAITELRRRMAALERNQSGTDQ